MNIGWTIYFAGGIILGTVVAVFKIDGAPLLLILAVWTFVSIKWILPK